MTTVFRPVITLLIIITFSMKATTQGVPLIDRDIFFGNPEISGGKLSPDGSYISFLHEFDGIMNIWVKRFDEPFEKARPLTDSNRPLYGYFWTEDGKYILYAKDTDGDENINIYAVSPEAKAVAGRVPESRNLTPMANVTARIYHVSRKNPDRLFVGLNDRDEAWHDLYELNIQTGALKSLYQNAGRITGYEFDDEDRLRIVSRTDELGTTTLLRNDNGVMHELFSVPVTETAYTAGWNEDLSRCYLVTNQGELDKSALFLIDMATGALEHVESDPENRVDFGGLRLHRDTREIISTSYVDDRKRTYWRNGEWEANYTFLVARFEGREVNFQSATRDYSRFLVVVSGDRFASESYFFDASTRELIFQYTPRPALKRVEAHLAGMEAIRYTSIDGLEIPAYLTLPPGTTGRNLPLVVLVHGGPKGPRDYWGYDPEVQFLANRGYAVLQPNFRASGGYGKNFLNAGDLEWGKLMQDDITAGVHHLIGLGVADEDRIAIMGGSYGGYATLAGLAFTPDLYACGIDIVGPSNLFTLLESIPAYWEAGRAFLHGMLGNPDTEEGRERIKEASPLFSADKIKKPLLIIQGANDPRVKQHEADQIAVALRKHGLPVTYLLADDEGHGFSKPVNKMAMYAAVEQFLSEHLDGRYQAEMPVEVSDRLREMTVNVNQLNVPVE